MQVEIRSIRVRKSLRKELDDVGGLAESMGRFGQIHPILITAGNALVTGRRRLEAAKLLGWKTIDATVIGITDRAQLLELKLEENVQRTPLTRDEIADALARLDRLKHPGILRRIWYAIVDFFRRLFSPGSA